MKVKFTLAVIGLAFAANVLGQNSALQRQDQYNLKNNLALKGYDPVAYTLFGKALKGNKDLNVSWKGVTYYFAFQSTKDLFNLSPAKYEPTYGGWCAYAMGKRGEKVSIDPEAFKIVDGKVYLFYGKSQVTDWNKEEAALKTKADRYWQGFYK
ncbi:MAG: YHS domain-containing (seleno)protein [Chitinophagaceae bacterium]